MIVYISGKDKSKTIDKNDISSEWLQITVSPATGSGPAAAAAAAAASFFPGTDSGYLPWGSATVWGTGAWHYHTADTDTVPSTAASPDHNATIPKWKPGESPYAAFMSTKNKDSFECPYFLNTFQL